MSLTQVTIDDVEFDVYYDVEIEKDPYGTGDSPTSLVIDIHEIELAGSVIDITPFISTWTYDHIYDEVLKQESELL